MKALSKVLLLCLTLVLISAQCEKEPDPNRPINIPDLTFLHALFEEGVDANGDGQISYDEAEVVTELEISGKRITSVDGIQAFINLEVLNLSDCQITNPDLSALTALHSIDAHNTTMKILDLSQNEQMTTLCCPDNQLFQLILNENASYEFIRCSGNKINELDLKGCAALQLLYCDRNQISSLDLSDCPLLESVDCSSNRLTSLNINNNIALRSLSCGENQFTSLDISNNFKPGTVALGQCCLNISGMPNLQEVCVRTMLFPPEGLVLSTEGSPNVYFTTECSKYELSRIIH